MYYIYQTLADVEHAFAQAKLDEVEAARSRAAATVTASPSAEPVRYLLLQRIFRLLDAESRTFLVLNLIPCPKALDALQNCI